MQHERQQAVIPAQQRQCGVPTWYTSVAGNAMLVYEPLVTPYLSAIVSAVNIDPEASPLARIQACKLYAVKLKEAAKLAMCAQMD